MKIGLDFDGVIANCGQLKSIGVKRLFGLNIPISKFNKEIILREKLLTPEQYRELHQLVYGEREFSLLLKPVDGALYFIPKLITNSHTVIVVTARGEKAVKIAEEWSVRHGLELSFISVGDNSKADAVAGYDIYIDDDIERLEQMASVVQHLFLFSWGYNAHISTGAIAKRVESWEEFFNIIQALAH